MSTSRDDMVDPAEQKAMFITGGVLVTLAAGYAAFRISMVVHGDGFPGFWFGTELTIAYLVSFVGAGFMIIADRTEQDRSLLPAFALLLLGAAAGLVLAALVFGVPLFSAGVPLFITGVLLLSGLVLFLTYLMRRQRTTRLLSDGCSAEATIVHVQKSSSDGDSFYEETRYTLAFSGEDGTRHTVAGRAMFPTGKLPETGETVAIRYDPQKPNRHVLLRKGTDETESR